MGFAISLCIMILSELRPFNPYAFALSVICLIPSSFRYIVLLQLDTGYLLEYLTYWLLCSFFLWALKKRKNEIKPYVIAAFNVLVLIVGNMVWSIFYLFTVQIQEVRLALLEAIHGIVYKDLPWYMVCCFMVTLAVFYIKDVLIAYEKQNQKEKQNDE